MSRSQYKKGMDLLHEIASSVGLDLSIIFSPSGEIGVAVLGLSRGDIKRPDGTSSVTEMYVSGQFISDLPAMEDYQATLLSHYETQYMRLNNPYPNAHMTLRGIPLVVEVKWPLRMGPGNRDSYFAETKITAGPWIKYDRTLHAAISGTVEAMVFPTISQPFTEPYILNVTRREVDRPDSPLLQKKEMNEEQIACLLSDDFEGRNGHVVFMKPTEKQVKSFLLNKVYWLGFRGGPGNPSVWVVDPLDAQYLNIPKARIGQLCQVLHAEGLIEFNIENELAKATNELISQDDDFDVALRRAINIPVSEHKHPPKENEGLKGRPSAFISYSSRDKQFAEKLAVDLRNRNLGVWFADWEIKVGDSLMKKIGGGIRENDFLIVILSPESVRSEWVAKELAEAMQKEIKEKRVVVLPALKEVCDLPPFLSDKRYADFTNDYHKGLGELVNAITSHHHSD